MSRTMRKEFIFALCLLPLLCMVKAAQELEIRTVCSKYELRLRCDANYFVVVHDAYFTTNPLEDNYTCIDTSRESENINCTENIRKSVNSRCSGMTHCLFTFNRDHAERRCPGEGIVVAKYRCVTDASLNKYCTMKLNESEGLIASPGFPSFYPEQDNCSWIIEGSRGQTIDIRVLDVHMRYPQGPYPIKFCEDYVTISEGHNKLYTGCGADASALQTIKSTLHTVTVRFHSKKFVPSRGFIIKYKLVGCPTVPPPNLGYMVHRNSQMALYKCCKDHFFNDTLRSTRTLLCVDGNHWNATMATCASAYELAVNGSILEDEELENLIKETEVKERVTQDWIALADILVPSVLLGGLVLGNIIIVIVIFKMRRRHKTKQNGSSALKPVPHRTRSNLASVQPAEV